jgi:signal transduction histidine kinase
VLLESPIGLIESRRMSLFRRHICFIAAAGITLAYALMSLVSQRSFPLAIVVDSLFFLVMLSVSAFMFVNAATRSAVERMFWLLMGIGFFLWALNQVAWIYLDARHLMMPSPYFADIILFFHIVPMIAAIAWRPDQLRAEPRHQLTMLHFLMLLGWWVFLYAFVVFPHQYVVLNVDAYNRDYDLLYDLESVVLLVLMAFAAWTSSGGWKRVYLNFFAAGVLYAAGSQLLSRAMLRGSYYSGSLYDIPLLAAILWMGATVLSSREWGLKSEPSHAAWRWRSLTPKLATLAILSLPFLGMWTFLIDHSPAPSRIFRIFAVLTAMLVLGAFVFLRQYVQDQKLIGLLQDSRRGFENQQRLQSQLVQHEKLASLGQLVAGAAHEINHPLSSVMSHSEQLWSEHRLTEHQDGLVRKIVDQARRTQDLVSGLLSFARQSPGEKTFIDLRSLLHRSTQMLEAQHHASRIRVEISIDPQFPRVCCNGNQLFQVFVEIIENAMDALEEAGGGLLRITAWRQAGDAVVEFSDTGPGLREPQRVFDPFYTTKPIGKGTGLGLSAVYGIIQDHGGQITCQNRPEGGALFSIRLPVAAEAAAQTAASAKA